MSRLPTVGGDENTWGKILNDFLAIEHNGDGSQKTVPISKGGTGATDVATARSNIGAASDSAVVHKSGTETISGDKDFTGAVTKNGANLITRIQDAPDISLTGASDGDPLVYDATSGGAKPGSGGSLSATGDVTITSDSDGNGAGSIILKTGGVERASIDADGMPSGLWLPRPIRQTAVIFGDSITSQNVSASGHEAAGYWTQAQMRLGHRFTLLKNAGAGGNRTDQMLARIDADVLAYDPGFVIVQGGGNDIGQDIGSATIIANLTTIYHRLLAAGCVVVATTALPSSSYSTAARKAVYYAVNNWLRGYVPSHPGMILCDWARAVQDPSGSSAVAGLTSDGVHPSQAGAYLLGQQLYNVLAPLTYAADPLPYSKDESGLILPNPRVVGNTGGVADSTSIFSLGGTPTLTKSKITRTDGIQGEWQQVAATGNTAGFSVRQQTTTNIGGGQVSVGDLIYGVAEVEIDAGATMCGAAGESPVRLALISQDGTIAIIYDCFAPSSAGTYAGIVPSGRLVLRTPNFIVPGGGSSRLFLRVEIYVNGTVRVGSMQVYKTTATSIEG